MHLSRVPDPGLRVYSSLPRTGQYKGPQVTLLCASWWGDPDQGARAEALSLGSPFLRGWPGVSLALALPGLIAHSLDTSWNFRGGSPTSVPLASSPRCARGVCVTKVWGRSQEQAQVRPSQAVQRRCRPGLSSLAWAAGGAAARTLRKHFRRAPAFRAASEGWVWQQRPGPGPHSRVVLPPLRCSWP